MELYYREIALIISAYALGCVSTGYYLVRFRKGDDLRRLGSGNAGTRNVGRVLGPWGFAITLIGDTAKGIIPVIGARLLGFDPWVVVATGLASVAGHVFPAQMGFRGGKGLATTVGVVIALDFTLVIAALTVAAIAWLVWRNMNASGLIGVALTPLVGVLTRQPQTTIIALVIFASVLMFNHRGILQTILFKHGKPSGDAI